MARTLALIGRSIDEYRSYVDDVKKVGSKITYIVQIKIFSKVFDETAFEYKQIDEKEFFELISCRGKYCFVVIESDVVVVDGKQSFEAKFTIYDEEISKGVVDFGESCDKVAKPILDVIFEIYQPIFKVFDKVSESIYEMFSFRK